MWGDAICILRWSSQSKWVISSCLEGRGLPSPRRALYDCIGGCVSRLFWEGERHRMVRPVSSRALKSRAMAVCWVDSWVKHKERRARAFQMINAGADSVAWSLLEKLEAGGCCVYRWALSLTQVSKPLTPRAQLWEMLYLERVGWPPRLCSHHLEYVRKVSEIEILAFLSLLTLISSPPNPHLC